MILKDVAQQQNNNAKKRTTSFDLLWLISTFYFAVDERIAIQIGFIFYRFRLSMLITITVSSHFLGTFYFLIWLDTAKYYFFLVIKKVIQINRNWIIKYKFRII